MTIGTTTEPDAIARLLDPLLLADPVRGTVLGTIRASATDTAWCAHTSDGAAVAARSEARFPVALGGTWPAAALPELGTLLAALPDLAGLTGPASDVDVLTRVLAPVSSRMDERLFRLDTLTEPTGVSGSARVAVEADRDLALSWYDAFAEEAHAGPGDRARAVDTAIAAGGCWLWCTAEGRPAAMAVRQRLAAGSARVGPVYTPPQLRGHGYGSAATAAATRDILRDGGIPVLFTDLANPVSNAIYPRLGYYAVEDRVIVRFG